MKKFVIIYTIISIVLLVIYTMISVYNSYYSRVLEVYDEITTTAAETYDFDTYVSFQTQLYEKIEEVETNGYQFTVYLSKGQQDTEDLYQLSIYVIPLGTATYAISVDDANDQSDIRFTDDNHNLLYALTEDENFNDEAISYGILTMGFYYAVMDLSEYKNINIEVIDYDGNSIYTTSYDYTQGLTEGDANVYAGMSEDEFAAYIDFDTNVRPKIMLDVALFLVVDVLVGTALYFIRKKSKKL